MAELKCKNCGGIMQTDETNDYAICEYCGTKQKIEKSEAEIKADLLRKKEEQKAQHREKFNKTTKKVNKIILIILIVILVPIILFFGSAIVMGIIESFSDENEETTNSLTTIVTESQTEEVPTQNQENNSYYFEPIEITNLFSGSLQNAEELLEPQSKAPQDLEAYTRYTYNCVTVMCGYGTDNIYSISVDYTNKNTNVEYTVFGLTENTTRMNWDSALGEMLYQGYDSDGNPVYSYELAYDENTTYNIEITATSDCPDKITVYKYQY